MQVVFLYVTAVLIWGTTWAAIPFQLGVVAEELSVAYRFGIGALVMFAYAGLTGRKLTIPLQHYGLVVLMGMLMFSANYLFTYYAINYVTSGLVAVVFSLLVVMNAMFERLFFARPLESRLLIAAMLGVIGVACLFWPEVRSFNLGDLAIYGVILALVSVTFASLGNMAAIASTGRGYSVISLNAHGQAWGAMTSLTAAMILGRPFDFLLETGYILSLLYLSLFGSAVAFACYLALMRRIGSARAAYTSVLFPVVALLVSTLVENYQWSLPAVTGILFIVAGNWLALKQPKEKLINE